MNGDLEDELSAIITAYDEGTLQLRNARDNAIRTAAAQGMRQVDIVRVTGYNRETIRQIVRAGEGTATRMNLDRMRARAQEAQDAAAERAAAERHAAFLETPLGRHVAEMGRFFQELAGAFAPSPKGVD